MLFQIQAPPFHNLKDKVQKKQGKSLHLIDTDQMRRESIADQYAAQVMSIAPAYIRVLIVNNDVVSRHRMKFIASMKTLGFENIHSIVFESEDELVSEVMRIDPDLVVFDISHSRQSMLTAIRRLQHLSRPVWRESSTGSRPGPQSDAKPGARPLILINRDQKQEIMAEAMLDGVSVYLSLSKRRGSDGASQLKQSNLYEPNRLHAIIQTAFLRFTSWYHLREQLMSTHFSAADNDALATTHASTASPFQIRSVRWPEKTEMESDLKPMVSGNDADDDWDDVDWGHMSRMHARMMARSHTQIHELTNDNYDNRALRTPLRGSLHAR